MSDQQADDEMIDDLYDEYELAVERRIAAFGYGPDYVPLPWTDKPPLRNDERVYDKGQGKAAFEEEQRHKITQFIDDPKPKPLRVLHTTEHAAFAQPAPGRKNVGLYICQVCRTEFALWPSEIAKKFGIFGATITVCLRSPIACTQCRFMRFKEVSRLGRLDHRPLWKNIFALVSGQEPPVLTSRMYYAMRWRQRLSPSALIQRFREWM